MDQQKINQALIQFQDELNQAVAGFKMKGWEHFKKVLGVAAALAFVGYALLYKATASQLNTVSRKVVTLREISKYAAEYKDLKTKVDGLKDHFPSETDRKDWLFNLILTSAKEQGIAIDAISSQKDEERPDLPFIKLSIDVQAKGTYEQVGNWLAKLEGTGKFTQVENLSLSKLGRGGDSGEQLSMPSKNNTVSLTLTTVIPRGLNLL